MLRESAGDGCQQSLRIIWLFEKAGGTLLECDALQIFFSAASNVNDWHMIQPQEPSSFPAKKADRFRHPNIADDQIGILTCGGQNSIVAVMSDQHGIASGLQAHLQRRRHSEVVFDNEDC